MAYYGAMSASRSIVEIGVSVFHCVDVVYSDELHRIIAPGQARVTSFDDTDLGDVYAFFGINSTQSFRSFITAVQRKIKYAGQMLSSCKLGGVEGDDAGVNWRTTLVLLCETRQALKRWGVQELLKLFGALKHASDDVMRNIRRAHAQLMVDGYPPGRRECHCTVMVRAAAAALDVTMREHPLKSSAGRDTKQLRDVALQLAYWRLSPKVTLRNIPECAAMKEVVQSLRSFVDSVMATPPTVESMRKELMERGITPPRGATKVTLLESLASNERPPLRPTKTLMELRVLVRRIESGRKVAYWTADECRSFLLKRKRLPELRVLAAESGMPIASGAAKLSKEALVEKLAKNRRMY